MLEPYHALCPLLHHLVQPPCWALIFIILSSCQAVEPVAWKQPFTPVHSKWERKGLILPRLSSSQRKHHRLSEMRSYKNSLTLQPECSGRAENPSSVLTDAQCLMEAGATPMCPVQMGQTLYFFVVHFLLIVQRQKLCLLQTHVNQLLQKSL